MVKCINCGVAAVVVSPQGLRCRVCNYEWDFEREKANAVYIKNVLRRDPITRYGDAVEVPIEDRVMTDDLTRIDGIGEKTSAKLNELGIFTYSQMVEIGADEIASLIPTAGKEAVLSWLAQAEVLSRA